MLLIMMMSLIVILIVFWINPIDAQDDNDTHHDNHNDTERPTNNDTDYNDANDDVGCAMKLLIQCYTYKRSVAILDQAMIQFSSDNISKASC